MELIQFLRNATPQQRRELAEAAQTTVGYLYQIASVDGNRPHRRASLEKATKIEKASREFCRRHRGKGRLGIPFTPIPRQSLVSRPDLI